LNATKGSGKGAKKKKANPFPGFWIGKRGEKGGGVSLLEKDTLANKREKLFWVSGWTSPWVGGESRRGRKSCGKRREQRVSTTRSKKGEGEKNRGVHRI